MFRFLNFLLILVLTVGLSQAGSLKKYAGEFLSLGAGGRSLGMAGAGSVVAGDVTAGYWNPAGLVDAEGFQMEFMHSKQFISSIQHNYLGFSQPMRDGSTLGLSVLYLTVNSIKDSRQFYSIAQDDFDYSRIKTFNTGDYSLFLSYAKPMSEKLSYGANVKFIYRDYQSETALGIGFDAGLKYKLNRKLALGLMLRDITSTMMSWSTNEKEFITPSIRFGASYLVNVPKINLTLEPAFDVNVLFENRSYASQYDLGAMSLDTFWGMEVAYKKLLAVRLGLDDLNRFNTGIGLQIPKIAFDYSFTAYQSELGDIHRISFHLKFDTLF